jgi:hypothetical protein
MAAAVRGSGATVSGLHVSSPLTSSTPGPQPQQSATVRLELAAANGDNIMIDSYRGNGSAVATVMSVAGTA